VYGFGVGFVGGRRLISARPLSLWLSALPASSEAAATLRTRLVPDSDFNSAPTRSLECVFIFSFRSCWGHGADGQLGIGSDVDVGYGVGPRL
jgi:hypothetical protein